MKKYFLLSCVLISQTYSMELTRRRHQTPTPVAMDQEAPAPIIIDQVDTQQSNGDNIVTTDDLWDSCKRRILFGTAAGSCSSAIAYLTVCAIPMAMGLGGPALSTSDLVMAGGIYFGPPICCCALSTCLCKRALKGMDQKKALLLFAMR